MKTIFITMSKGALIRNYFKTGFMAKLLERGVRVVVLSPFYQDEEIFGAYRGDHIHFEPLFFTKMSKLGLFVDALWLEFGKGVVYSSTVLAHYKYLARHQHGYTGKKPKKFLYYPRIAFFFLFRFFPGIKILLRKIHFLLFPQREHDHLFKKYHPDLVFITDFVDSMDVGVCKSAQRYGVPTAGMAKSWDNFSKSLFRVKTNALFVWGEFARQQALNYQGFYADEITPVGGLQFDYYRPENTVNREEFCRELGLDKDKQIVFYGSTGLRCWTEYEYIDLILDIIKSEGIQAQLLIRPHLAHPGDEKKFDRYLGRDDIVIYRGQRNTHLPDNWDLSDDHLRHIYNSIYHAAVSVNIASTLTLDSIAVGTPVINISFDVSKRAMADSVLRFYKTDYTGAVARFGGSWLTRSPEEFRRTFIKILSGKADKKEMVEKMRQYFLYKTDGCAGERLVKIL
ncbi:MAG: hypothetical protein A3D92_05875 [Bacteroidetes bacterium RIFCSPHIGHO2_02_FULL_44_7]|nr:MAG: hypothetical protein A3D92_05875 [Bacteroidetes bacterium RIFCSPHIGHO2_02_FULL_44_7]